MKTVAQLEKLILDNPRLRPLHAHAKAEAERNPDAGHDLSHFLRVALWTIRLGEGKFPDENAIAAGLLHDIVNVPKNSPDRARASELSEALASRYLAEAGFGEDEIREIGPAIRTHSFSRCEEPVNELGRALQDADRLESLGAIGLARVFATGGRLGSTIFEPRDPWGRERILDDRAYMVDHFFLKLLRLPDTMKTAAGRREARKRAGLLEEFVRNLGEELANPRDSGDFKS